MAGQSVQRGGQHIATFKGALALDTSTSLNKIAVIASGGTVGILNTVTSVPIGHIIDTEGGDASTNCAVSVSLFWPTKRGVAGGSISAGGKLTYNNSAQVIAAAGTLTGVPVVGVAIEDAIANQVFEYFPVYFNSIPIA